jgi:hypothetical protein
MVLFVVAAWFPLRTSDTIALKANKKVVAGAATPAAASAPKMAADASTDHAADNTIPPGTAIAMQNWQQYRQSMPNGMVDLFEGKYFWRIPVDMQMEVGPTVIQPSPKGGKWIVGSRDTASRHDTHEGRRLSVGTPFAAADADRLGGQDRCPRARLTRPEARRVSIGAALA